MRVDEASRTVGAGPDAVWHALTDPHQVAQWLPPNDMTGDVETYDVRPGGAYRMTLRYAAGGNGKSTEDSDVVSGRFVEVVTRARLVQTADFVSDDPAFAGTMTMTWTLRAVADGTEITVQATDVPPGISPEDHAEGLASSLANLAALLESDAVH